jgi:DNA-binding transcriptional LysR family regulator
VDESPAPAPTRSFRVAFVTGVTPDKWANAWRRRLPDEPLVLVPVDEDQARGVLRDDERVAMSFVRLPVDREGLHVIPLYREQPVVVVSREHPVAAYDEIAVADLADEHLLQDPDAVPEWRDLATEVRDGSRFPVPPMTTKQAVESVAADAGILILPMSVARVHQRKDVRAVPVTGVAESQIGLAWRVDDPDPRIETFVGIVRGRTERSSRGETSPPAVKTATAKPTAGRSKTRTPKPRPRGASRRQRRR